MYIWKSLSLKLIIAFLLVAGGSIVVVSLIQSQQVAKALLSDTGHLLHTSAVAEARLIGSSIDTQIMRLHDISIDDLLAEEVALQETRYPRNNAAALRQIETEDAHWRTAHANDPLVVRVVDSPLASHFRSHVRTDYNMVELMFTDRRGALITSNVRTSDYYQADEEWWQQAAKNKIFVSNPDVDQSSGAFSIIIAIAVYHPDTGAFLGVLRSTYNTDTFTRQLGENHFSKNAHANLIVNNAIIEAEGDRYTEMTPADQETVQSAREVTYLLASYEGKPSLITLAPVVIKNHRVNLDWTVILSQDSAEALAPVLSAQISAFITALIVLAAAAVLATAGAELLISPIRRITAVAEEIAAGDLSKRVGRYSNDEIGRMARSFDMMSETLQERIHAEEVAQAERIQMQQEMIDAQDRRIEELTAPAIPLGHGILLLPLIGSIDQRRAERVLQTILADVHARRASKLILDMSGLRIVDREVMSVLLRAAAGASLLGARVIFVGIRSQTAQTLVDLDVSLGDMTIYASLHDALDAER
ncbi:putative PAS/PAC sensor protein [Oscillochloris trichoides DG-6]|uniref:PAS/PAC sensor protein n=1 Tax=Oscillochloris trichoides DG-6 TaxID=765420 RepID=E1IE39_9CHLR|nr:HAMP domain-containing protein [Oscillochloris trichoides]EFO80553.1 putative PAS/PAC sensor protein [Oscillochloris trichoides DG-6]